MLSGVNHPAAFPVFVSAFMTHLFAVVPVLPPAICFVDPGPCCRCGGYWAADGGEGCDGTPSSQPVDDRLVLFRHGIS
jgi:hypothetical protein